MDSLKIDTGAIRLAIDDDPTRIIEFNTSDVVFAERFQALQGTVVAKLDEFQKHSRELAALSADPKATPESIQENTNTGNLLRREMCVYMRKVIDDVFGADTSQIVFGDLLSEVAIMSFLEGVLPYMEKTRSAKMAKYLPKASGRKRHNDKVME